jgi:hypothetical protein
VAVAWVANSGIPSYVSPQGEVRVRVSGFWANSTNLWNWSNALYWEVSPAVAAPDPDGDGLPNTVETNTGTYNGPGDTGTDPFVADTDGDGLLDGAEVNTYGTNPTLRDSDGDGFGDGVENGSGTNPNDPAGPWPAADGDLAPLNIYDGVVNAGDLLVAGRMALGLVPQDALVIAHGDLATNGSSAGIIDTADVLLILQQVLNGP